MTRMRLAALAALLVLVAAALALAAPAGWSSGDPSGHKIVIRDDCDRSDPAWEDVGGCTLRKGEVTTAEFGEELTSPLSDAVIGHQAWRNDPPYLELRAGKKLHVKNEGGRPHTFTEVAAWGGGIVPDLNMGLDPAPECDNASFVEPGGRERIDGLGVGNHRFICCLHPWMRALVKVKPHA